MREKLLSSAAAVAALAMIAGGPVPAYAHETAEMCNPVVDGDGEPVMEADGDVVTYTGSVECPPEPEPVAEVATPAPVQPAAPPPEPLPEDGTIYFDLDKAELTPEAEASLDEMISAIKDRELGGITVAGHTDRSGDSAYNEKLSRERADAVANYLIRAGVPARVIDEEWYGEEQPAVPTEDGVILQENRRAVIGFEEL